MTPRNAVSAPGFRTVYFGGTIGRFRRRQEYVIVQLSPKLADPIKTDADLKRIASRPEFLAIIHTVGDLRKQKPK